MIPPFLLSLRKRINKCEEKGGKIVGEVWGIILEVQSLTSSGGEIVNVWFVYRHQVHKVLNWT